MAAQLRVHTESAKSLDGPAQALFPLPPRTQFLDPGLTLLYLSPAGPYQGAFTSPLLTLRPAGAVLPGDVKYPQIDESLSEVLESLPSFLAPTAMSSA